MAVDLSQVLSCNSGECFPQSSGCK